MAEIEANNGKLGDVIIEVRGRLGLIRLNRPKALNALNMAMVVAMTNALLAWRDETKILAVLIDHMGDRGFCAGGDVRSVAQLGDENADVARDFFYKEYQLNHLIGTYPKPIIAVMDGVTMGGGAGISIHASIRIATENTLFAMPEAAIGFFPDIGASHFLAKLPKGVGAYLVLLGARINGAKMMDIGLADIAISSAHRPFLPDLLADLLSQPMASSSDVAALEATIKTTLAGHQCQLEDGFSAERLAQIALVFAGEGLDEIKAALRRDPSGWAAKKLEALEKLSVQSQLIGLEQLKRAAKGLDLAACLTMDYNIASRLCLSPDFNEGVRSVLIDKDFAPNWSVQSLSEDEIKAYFAAAEPAWRPL